MLTSGLPVVYVPNINIISKSLIGIGFFLIKSTKVLPLKIMKYKHCMFI